jgi:hypothetical protein
MEQRLNRALGRLGFWVFVTLLLSEDLTDAYAAGGYLGVAFYLVLTLIIVLLLERVLFRK